MKGSFVWYELLTTDTKGAQAFYGDVVGWTAKDSGMPGMDYTLLHAGSDMAAGLMEQPEDAKKMGAPPSWLGYVGVDDVDASTAKAKGLGATVYVEPHDIPGVGRFSVIADPQMAVIALFKGSGTPQEPPAPGTPGRIGWHELWAADWEKAFAFYKDMFGWQKFEGVDMGPMGTYQLFGSGGGAAAFGGMFNKPAEVPACFWLYYFNVPDVDSAGERVKSAGGEVVMGPMQVPGGDWIIQGKDPQGAMFALVGKRPSGSL